jgi:branched-chain amino acid transport system permease protein
VQSKLIWSKGMEIFIAQMICGLACGSIYALLVTGFNLLLVVTGAFYFAFPHVVVMSMYICWMVIRKTSGNLFLGVTSAVFSGVGISLISEPIFRPLTRRGAAISTFILSLGIAMIIQDPMARVINEGTPIGFPAALSGKEALIHFGVITITLGQILTIVGCIVAVVTFLYLLYKTKNGRAFRSMAQNIAVARILGIPITKMSLYCYFIAGILGGISSVFLAMSLGAASATLGDMLALKVIAAALLAGLGNLKGGLVTAFILGLVESFVLGYLPGDWSNAVAFALIIGVVMTKPEGLFGVKA